jgi:hypothetical protein
MRRAGALILALALAGCASLSEKQCRSGDWRALGEQDGARGTPVTELEQHRKACDAHGVKPDEALYRAGHAAGLARYCTPSSAYEAGRAGGGSSEACPPATVKDFQRGLHRGREVYRLLVDLRELRRQRDELQLAAMSGDYAPEDRTQLRFRADELNDRVRMKEWDLERLDRRYAREFGAPELDWNDLRW